MDVMTIFDVVMIGLGVYIAAAAFNMKKNNEIGTVILADEEVNKCKDKTGFIAYIYWREAVLGAALILYGAIGLLDKYIFKLGGFLNYIPIILLLLVFAWFYKGLQSARADYLY